MILKETVPPPTSLLPPAAANVVVDGETQPGYGGRPIVEIQGAAGTSLNGCFRVRGVLRGLSVTGCNAALYAESGSVIEDNFFGLAPDGVTAVGNRVGIWATRPLGLTGIIEIRRNVFSYNLAGLNIFAPAHVTGNLFGTTAAGVLLESTRNLDDLYVDALTGGTTIGGPAPGDGNVLAGGIGFFNGSYNSDAALHLKGASQVTVQGNIIGLPGSRGYSGRTDGVEIERGTNNLIAGNTISGFQRAGVLIWGTGSSANVISRNSMSANQDGGIRGDSLPAQPAVTGITVDGGSTTISGTINGLPNTQNAIELFSSLDDSGCFSAETYLGTTAVTTGASGAAAFQFTVTTALPAGSIVTSTTTPLGGSTSRYASCTVVNRPGAFEVSNASFSESAGNAIVNVYRVNGITGIVSVSYETTDATAKAGNDYVATSGLLTFADGETVKSISIPIIDDAVYEGLPPENFTLKLTNPTGGATILLPTANITILDNDPMPLLSVSDVRVIEGNSGTTNAVLTLTATAPISGSVVYDTHDGTATAGIDYQQQHSTVQFNGETTKTITIPIYGDTEVERNENLTVSLIAFPGSPGWALTRSEVTVTIVNDDTGVGPAQLVIERGTAGAIVINLGANTAPQTLTFSSSNPAVATVVNSAQIAGNGFVTVMANSAGHTLITATLPPEFGSAATSVDVTVTDKQAPPPSSSLTRVEPAAAGCRRNDRVHSWRQPPCRLHRHIWRRGRSAVVGHSRVD